MASKYVGRRTSDVGWGKDELKGQGGFTMTEVLLSVAIWGILIVPFLVYYGGMQKALYLSHSQLNVLNVSRFTMDQVSDDLRRIDGPTVLASANPDGLCFSYTPIDTDGGLQPSQNVSYRWDSTAKKLMFKKGTGTLASFCNTTGEQPMPAFGNDAFINGASFSYYDTTGTLVCGSSGGTCPPNLSPPNFRRVTVSMTYRPQPTPNPPPAPPDVLLYTTATNVTARNLETPAGTPLGTFPVGTEPFAIAIDAAGNAWVANNVSGNVTKLSPTGTVLDTFSLATVTNPNPNPRGVAIDAAGNAWVTIFNDTVVVKLSPTGVELGRFTVGTGPMGIAIHNDGSIWVANANSNNVMKLDPTTGTVLDTFWVTPEGSSPQFVAIDGTGNAWTSNGGSNNVTMFSSAGAKLGTFIVGTNPWGIAIDAAGNAWVANNSAGSVAKISSDGSTISTFPVGIAPRGIAVDGSGNVWVTNAGDNNVMKLSPAGAVLGTFGGTSGVEFFPLGIAIDAAGYVWAGNASSNTVTKLSG